MQAPWRVQIFFVCLLKILVAQEIPSTTSPYSQAVRLHNQGILSQEWGRFAEAESAFREAPRAWDALPSPCITEMAATLNDLGNLLRFEGRYIEAEQLLRRAISYEEKAGASARLDLASKSRFSRQQVSVIHVSDLPTPPSPTNPQALYADFARYPSSRRVSRSRGSRFHHFPAGSPTLTGRIEFVILRMNRSPPAAHHPASRRRSSSWLQAGGRIPEEDFHLSDQTRFQAHWEGQLAHQEYLI